MILTQVKKGEFLSIERKWNPGDRITMSFDMPVNVIPGGISYPNDVAIQRGPQILAIDQGLNPEIASLNSVVLPKINNEILDAGAKLPTDWDWKEAYFINMKIKDVPQKVIMVPFSEAGQKNADIAVWIQYQP